MTKFQIIQGDCLELLTDLPREGIDVIVTSPPYNIGLKYNIYNDDLLFKDYLKWIEKLAIACYRTLKKDGSFFLNIGDKASDEFRSFKVAERIATVFRLQNTIHWIKSIDIPEKDFSSGHFKPVNSNRFLNNSHEYIFHFTKNNDVVIDKLAIGVPYKDKSNNQRWKTKKTLRGRGNIWFIPYKTVSTSKNHPASFPEKLPEMCIKLHGVKEKLKVLDPLCGSGSTGVAALKLGCEFIGLELDKDYCELANNRIKEIANQTKIDDF